MRVPFTKMHGTGNDFVVVDCLEKTYPVLFQKASRICDRRYGIGADQILALFPSRAADFRMRIFNADGSEVEMCGNGIRCLSKFIADRRISKKKKLRIETLGGIVQTALRGNEVSVDMGEPILDGPKIPVAAKGQVIGKSRKFGDRTFEITCVSMGNPHCVIFVDDVDRFPVREIGPEIETDPFFPKRVNVEFVQVVDPSTLRVRVWERGSGETLACGTGACAALVAANLAEKTEKQASIHLPGGTLNIHWDGSNRIQMVGPATEVFRGVIHV